MEVYSQNQTALDVKSEKKLLVLGDSLSAAYKLSAEQGWVHLLQLRLTDNNYPYRVINASVSGATTAAGLQLMSQSLAQNQPDIVLLERGANDGLQGKPIPYIAKNLERLIHMAKQTNAKVILLGVRLPPNLGSRYTKPFYQLYPSLARTHRLPLVPFLLDGVAGSPEMMMNDGLHPKAVGQPIVLDNVWPVLKTVMDESL